MIFLAVALFALLSIVITTLKVGISPMPSYGIVKREFLDFLPSNHPGNIYELGCGFGSLLLPLSKRYPYAQIQAYEISFVPYLFAKLRTLRRKNITVVKRNFLGEPFEKNSMLLCYLFPKGMRLLEEKLIKEEFTGSVFTHTFSLPTVTFLQRKVVADVYRSQIMKYYFS